MTDTQQCAGYSRWMTNLPKKMIKRPINELAIPGSHNSGAYQLDPSTPMSPDKPRLLQSLGSCNKSLVIRWSLCQSFTITEQLNGGVRYFDMRPGFLNYEDDFFFVHGLHGLPIRGMLEEMRCFLDDNPQEILIVDFNHFHGFHDGDNVFSTHERLTNMIHQVFAGLLLSRDEINADVISSISLHDIWFRKRQVLLGYKDQGVCSKNPEFWFSKDLIFSPWHNTDSLASLDHSLNNLIKTRDTKRFNVFQGILTARKSTVLSNPNSTLRETLVTKCNAGLKKWLHHFINQREHQSESSIINIVMCDFICEDDLVPLILKLNLCNKV